MTARNTTTTRRAVLAGATAAPIAALAMGAAGAAPSPSPSLSPPIAAALAVVRECRARAAVLMKEETRLEAILLSDQCKELSLEAHHELRVGFHAVGETLSDAWDDWRDAIDQLIQIPAAKVADVEAKVRAVADTDDPNGLWTGDLQTPDLQAIWRDLIRLSAGGAA